MASTKRGRLKWLALRVGGRKLPVYLVPDGHLKLEGNNGMYFPDECAIYLNRNLVQDVLEDTLLHELDHAVNDISGAGNVLVELAHGKSRDDVEEQMVRCRTPIWLALLKDLGLRLPRSS